MRACVVTTIQEPTACMRALGTALEGTDHSLIVVGDRKGPAGFDVPGSRLCGIDEQLEMPLRLATLLPENHYARKNLGYLIAIGQGAASIYETDDDNMPLPSWEPRDVETTAERVEISGWVNVYRIFSDALLWPRGFPLDLVNDERTYAPPGAGTLETVHAPIQQGLANGSPDVDAVWRLILDADHRFDERPSLLLPPGSWCPFNSQSTWWWPEAYPLMYLPSFSTFRMTDIWRSFVAQRCLWELGHGVVFHGAEVFQDRNVHNLMRDFADEVPGYLGNADIATMLEGLSLDTGPDAVGENLLRCYEALVREGYLPEKELPLVRAWLEDVRGGFSR